MRHVLFLSLFMSTTLLLAESSSEDELKEIPQKSEVKLVFDEVPGHTWALGSTILTIVAVAVSR